jgi:hypothetical protein
MRQAAVVLSTAAVAGTLGALALKPTASRAARPTEWTAGPVRVVVGPNVLVTRDRLDPQYESIIAAHPTDPNILLGGVGIMRGPAGDGIDLYISRDRGYTWTAGSLPRGDDMKVLGDPIVAITSLGTGIATAITRQETPGQGRGYRYGAGIYRLEAGENDWKTVTFVADSVSFDHPQLAIDFTQSQYRGRIYIAKMGGKYPDYGISLFHSDDDGNTWTYPRAVVHSRADKNVVHGVNVHGLHVLRDGTVFMGYVTFDFGREGNQNYRARANPVYCLTSSDGGMTFSKPYKVYDAGPWSKELATQRMLGKIGVGAGGPKFAVDTASGPFQDRIYEIHEERIVGRNRIVFSWSRDQGRTWSKAKQVSQHSSNASQFQPAIAVGLNGVIGVLWYDTRRSASGDAFDVYFSASTDGGDTFTPARRISSESSRPRTAGNLVPTTGTEEDVAKQSLSLRLSTMFSYRREGGDYIGLATDALGAFHPWWPDSRTGTYHVWTARVDVVPASTKPSVVRDPVVKVDSLVGLVTDPGIAGRSSDEYIIPIRIRNFSKDTIYPPITVTVTKFTDLIDRTTGGASGRLTGPVLLTSKNGRTGVGAAMDYSNALGDWKMLPPGAVSEALPWRIRYPGRVQGDFIDISGTVKARVRKGSR